MLSTTPSLIPSSSIQDHGTQLPVLVPMNKEISFQVANGKDTTSSTPSSSLNSYDNKDDGTDDASSVHEGSVHEGSLRSRHSLGSTSVATDSDAAAIDWDPLVAQLLYL